MKLVIDTDPGIDDAMAILYAALHPEVELLALTTVFGNVAVETATRNALALVERAGLAIPVAQGAAQPLHLPPFTPPRHIHGDEGFGHLPAQTPAGAPCPETAVELLCRLARDHAGELVVCPIGPITNIALAIEADPEFARNVKQIVLMGGAVDVPGNITPHAEANAYHDPHAMDIVLRSGAPVVLVGLDVTLLTLLEAGDFAALAERAPVHGGFLNDISDFYLDFYRTVGHEGCALHDAMAVIAAQYPDLFRMEPSALGAVTEGPEIGRTLRLAAGAPVQVCLDCAADQVKALFLAGITH